MDYLKKQLKKLNISSINWSRFGIKVMDFIHMQAFLTLISLPILIAWGLPISLLSPIGNLIFSLPLTLFLLLSSLIFFCEILYIPNSILIWLLDKLTHAWTWSMSGSHKNLLIGFGKPSLVILCAIPLTACIIMQYRPTHPKRYATFLLCILVCIACVGLKIKDHYSSHHRYPILIPRGKGEIHLLKINNQLIAIDPGYIGSTISASAWVTYTLIPEITKQTGTLSIDHLIVLQLNSATLEALSTLCTKITVKKLYLPWWVGILKGKGWYNYKTLTEALYKNGGERIALNNTSIMINHQNNQSLLIKPTGRHICYKNITYPAYCVDGTIDNHSFTIYAAKHTKMKRIPE